MDNTQSKYVNLRKLHPDVIAEFERMCITFQKTSDMTDKTILLLNLAAATSGASDEVLKDLIIHCLSAGVSQDELIHSLFALTKTIGFLRIANAVAMVQHLSDKPIIKVSAGKNSCAICN
ncbi:MAG: hypothetical protein CVV41_22400 [Candidatus Riflebacteria bacterium HGW-Riflebacteria-1]|jgi:alkylhydroperoxidase/carboxymuconolactone decarboxylase family protein YurZ|nr:MAG: hypothetical protein CVV41_22400 [Candidatus Riflebacteria bacterium HGW-Riflebacteria-1]